MPKYHFNVENGRPSQDLDGTTLLDDRAARVAAVHLLGEVLQERSTWFWETGVVRLTVSDGAGAILFGLDVRATNAVAPPSAAARRSRDTGTAG